MVPEIRTVSLEPNAFYGYDRRADAFLDVGGNAEGREIGALVRQVTSAMTGLINRYDLTGKSVLSVGAGRAHEDFHFLKAGCKVDLLDLLDSKLDSLATSILAQIERAETENLTPLHYIIGDLEKYLAVEREAKYDLCYISGFGPDERDRETVQQSFRRRRTKDEAYASYVSWPDGMPPFLQMIMDSGRLLKEGGLFILQSYRGGVDIIHNVNYPHLIAEQMAKNSLELIEIHFFSDSPGIILVAAVRGIGRGDYWRQRLASEPALLEFHGRYADAGMRRRVERWRWPA